MTNTPWGEADHREQIAEGIVRYGTPSHGGFHLSRERNQEVPTKYREFAAKWSKGWGDTWYEEDCAALAVVVTFPEHFPNVTDKDYEVLRGVLDDYVKDPIEPR